MRRGVGLIRVSKVGGREDLVSPDLQRTAITRYTQHAGIEIVAWREALDESGSQPGSRWWATLDAIIAEVEAGQFDAVVAWKFSRAARHRLKWAVALDRIETAGATLESATEGVDTTTSTGRFTRGMLAELAAFEAERIGDVWKEVLQRRRAMGVADAQPRLGYLRENGLHRPDPDTRDLAAEIFRRFAAGEPLRGIAGDLNRRGLTTVRGNRFKGETIRDMVETGFAAGLLRSRGQYFPGAHEALIDMATWDRCRERLAARERRPGATSVRHTWSGLLVCGHCGKRLHATGYSGYPAGTRWLCSGPKHFTGCPGNNAWAPSLNRVVEGWLRQLAAGTDEQFQAALKAQPRTARERDSLNRALAKVDASLLSIAVKNERGFYDDDTYLQLRADLKDQQRMLQKQLAEVDQEPLRPAQIQTVLDAYLSLPSGEQQNIALRKVLKHVVVMSGSRPKYRPVGLWMVD